MEKNKPAESKRIYERNNLYQGNIRRKMRSSKKSGKYIKAVVNYIYFSAKNIYKELGIVGNRQEIDNIWEDIENDDDFEEGKKFIEKNRNKSSTELEEIVRNESNEDRDIIYPFIYHKMLLEFENGENMDNILEMCNRYEKLKK